MYIVPLENTYTLEVLYVCILLLVVLVIFSPSSFRYLLMADFDKYVKCQASVDAAYQDPFKWARMCLINISASGKFSSDRTIEEYAREIWHVEPNYGAIPAPTEQPLAPAIGVDM